MRDRPGKTVRTGFGTMAATPSIDRAKCTQCGLCVRACKTLTLIEESGSPVVKPDYGLGCIGCGQCMAVCPCGAVTVTGRRISPECIFDLPAKGICATPEQLDNLLAHRRSVREYAKREVEKTKIEKILAMASSAPMGIPPSDVGVTVILGHDRVWNFAGDMLGEFQKWLIFGKPWMRMLMRPFMKRAHLETMRDFIVPIVKEMLAARQEKHDLLFYHAPCVLLFHQSPYADPVDGHIACTYAMIAAESLDLGTCMIGTVAPGLNRNNEMKQKWGIPAENTATLAMTVGHPAIRYGKGIKRSFASVDYR